MNKLDFIKMQSLGNDFMVLDCIKQPQASILSTEQIKGLANRRFGIGFDQLLMLTASSAPEEFGYQIWNADGNKVGQCGNGARCVFSYLQTRKYCQQKCRLLTATAVIEVSQGETGPRATFGAPEFEPARIPLKADLCQQYEVDWEGRSLRFASLSVGNPHAILIVDDVKLAQVEPIGAYLNANSELFPERVNVSFLQQVSELEFNLRIYERGVGETPACGSAAAACAVAAKLLLATSQPIKLRMPGGQLLAQWPDDKSAVWVEGSTTEVFTGTIDLTNL